MKKLALLLTLAAAIAGSVMISSALAGSPNIVAQETGFTCGITDINTGGFIVTNQSSDTLYTSGKEQLHCVGQGTGNGSVVVSTNEPCNLIFTGFSANPANFIRASKTGELQLTCFSDGFSRPAQAGASGAQ